MYPQKVTVGRNVHFAPPQDCVGPKSLTLYPAIVTVIKKTNEDGTDALVDLVTFGPNSVYFQHDIPYSSEPKPGHWFWPTKV